MVVRERVKHLIKACQNTRYLALIKGWIVVVKENSTTKLVGVVVFFSF